MQLIEAAGLPAVGGAAWRSLDAARRTGRWSRPVAGRGTNRRPPAARRKGCRRARCAKMDAASAPASGRRQLRAEVVTASRSPRSMRRDGCRQRTGKWSLPLAALDGPGCRAPHRQLVVASRGPRWAPLAASRSPRSACMPPARRIRSSTASTSARGGRCGHLLRRGDAYRQLCCRYLIREGFVLRSYLGVSAQTIYHGAALGWPVARCGFCPGAAADAPAAISRRKGYLLRSRNRRCGPSSSPRRPSRRLHRAAADSSRKAASVLPLKVGLLGSEARKALGQRSSLTYCSPAWR